MAIADDPTIEFAREHSARGDVLDSFEHRFRTWGADDPRWYRFQDLMAVLEYGHEYSPEVEEGIDRPGRIAAASLEILDVAGYVVGERDEAEARYFGAVIHSAKIIESEALAFLDEAGARYSNERDAR